MADPEEHRAFAQGNPFSRALAGSGRPPPDDIKASSPAMYVVFGLMSLVLLVLFVAALVLPPMFTYTLIVRGVRTGRHAMTAAGFVMGALYFTAFVVVGRRLTARRAPPADS